jgi:hypothetical protein
MEEWRSPVVSPLDSLHTVAVRAQLLVVPLLVLKMVLYVQCTWSHVGPGLLSISAMAAPSCGSTCRGMGDDITGGRGAQHYKYSSSTTTTTTATTTATATTTPTTPQISYSY